MNACACLTAARDRYMLHKTVWKQCRIFIKPAAQVCSKRVDLFV
jgi:hypothetical protein